MTVMKVLAVLVLLLSAFLPGAHAETLIGDVRVVDGDTLEFEGLGITVRLGGIDAPESKQACEGADGSRYGCGDAATKALRQQAAGPVRCEGDEIDRYGRLIATCFTPEGLDLNGWMAEQGHALAYRRYSERSTPCLLGLYSIVALLAHGLYRAACQYAGLPGTTSSRRRSATLWQRFATICGRLSIF